MVEDALMPLQLLVGFVFSWSGARKAWQLGAFADTVQRLRIPLVPAFMAYPLAALLVIAELWIGSSLVFGYQVLLGSGTAIIVLLVMLAVVVVVLRRGDTVPCMCFGAGQGHTISTATLMRIALLLIASSASLAGCLLFPTRPAYPVEPQQFVHAAMTAVALLVLSEWSVSWHKLRSILRAA